MSTQSVQSSIMGCIDRLASWKAACQDVVEAGGGTLWTRVDASGDVDYENRVKGTDIAGVDSKIANLDAGAVVQKFFAVHADYFSNDLSISGGWSAYLAQQRFRIPADAGDLYYNAYSQRITAKLVFPEITPAFGTFDRTGGADIVSPTSGIASATYGPAGIDAVLSNVASPGIAILNVLGLNYLGSAVTMRMALSGYGIGSVFAVGAQAVVSDVSIGGLNIGVNSSGQYTVGDLVLVKESGKTELVTVASISANAYVRATSPVVNSFTTSAYLHPLFYKVGSAVTVADVTNGDSILFRPMLDRTPAW